MTKKQRLSVMRSLRAKLLILLVLLSLPLLIISLIQLRSYRRILNDQETVIAQTELASSAIALSAWLKERTTLSADLSPDEVSDLYERLRSQLSPASETSVAIFDAQGRSISNSPLQPIPLIAAADIPPQPSQIKWSDGITRSTMLRRIPTFDWRVAVGVSPFGQAHASTSALMLTVTWAAALLASSLLAIWAVGRFTKPVRILAASVSNFGRGNLQERMAVETSDEVGTLAEGFNTMAGQLQTRFSELQTQRAFIEEIINTLPLGLAVLDAQLNVRRVNPTFAQFVGSHIETLKDRGLYEAAGGLSVLSEMIDEVLRTRKPFVTYGLPLDLRGKKAAPNASTDAKDAKETGNHFWDLTLWPISAGADAHNSGDVVLILSEVSKRVRAEKLATSAFAAERARAAELESLINQMNEGVVIVDRFGRYRINPAAAAIIGRKRSEFRDGINALLIDIALRDPSGEKLPLERTPVFRAFEKGEHVSNEQLKILRMETDVRVLSVSATPLVGEGGKQDGAVAIFRDITEEVRQHDELVASYDRLREHDRLKSAFVATVSHEFRTPLNVIIGLCQLLERDRQPPLAPLQSEAITRMERNARALLELVNALLEYSRLEAGRATFQLESVSVPDTLEQAAREQTVAAQAKGINLVIEVAPELEHVVTDKNKLAKVVSHLVNNAIKFTSVGSVKVAAGLWGEDQWYLDVSDTGIGITSEALRFVFDEFRQVDDTLTRAYGGTGLGLAITRKIVELLDGTIMVESRPNEGSRFRIVWPRVARPQIGIGGARDAKVTELSAAKTRRRQQTG